VVSVPWERRFDAPIALLDGRRVSTLSHAHEVLGTIGPPAQHPAAWRYLGELLKKAAAGRAPMTEVEEMLMRALHAERMV
jgi:hypothetical protein